MLVSQAEKDGVRLRIHTDDLATNPRETDDNFGTMICFHRRYALGDVEESKKYDNPRDFMREVDTQDVVALPLYLYDHSGITMNTTGFSCPWDSGQVGWIYVTYDKIRSELQVEQVTEEVIEKVKEMLRAEVQVYDYFIRGDVYGFVLEQKKVCETCGHVEWEHIDSCWGFYGPDLEKNGIKDSIGEKYADLINNLKDVF